MLKFICCLFCLYSHAVFAQLEVPQVGETLSFGGMELNLTNQARKDIQSSVDALYRSEKHFNIMLERVDLYMPLIEPVLEKYGVPDEIKYLVIQESALVPDAISSSKAVGFWQFKEASATELDMRIDRQVDERMNIISATEGAAKYLLRSNAEFDNWLLSLQSYLTGQGGTSRSADKRLFGARKMKIDEDTHWYVKKYLAYKVAFENAVGKQNRNLILYQYTNTANKTLAHIAREFDMDEEQLESYNKWLKAYQIPDDKVYTVVVPLQIDESQDLLAGPEKEKKKKEDLAFGQKQQAPGKTPAASKDKLAIIEFNDLKAVVAREGDDLKKLAALGDIAEHRFRKFNDLKFGDKIQAEQVYYLERKYRKARMYEHVYQADESLWQIAQQYGLRLDKLLQKNRLRSTNEIIKPGQVLWLRFIRPRYEAVEYREAKPPKGNLYASTQNKVSPSPASAPTRTPSYTPPQKEIKAEVNEQVPVKKEAKNKEVAEEEKKGEEEMVEAVENTEKVKPALFPAGENTPENQKNKPYQQAEQAEKPVHQQKKLLYPEDSPTTQNNLPKETTQGQEKKNKVVQADTTTTQYTESKVQKKSEENTGLNGRQEEKEETVEGPSPEPKEPAVDSFTVDGPVNFVDEDKKKEIEQQESHKRTSSHEVKAGETLYSLSKQYNTSVQDLIKWNKLPSNPILTIGQQIIVAQPEALSPAPKPLLEKVDNGTETSPNAAVEQEKTVKYHTVSAGESMYRVARMYNVTIKDIMQWNNKDNFDLREGEELIVGKTQK